MHAFGKYKSMLIFSEEISSWNKYSPPAGSETPPRVLGPGWRTTSSPNRIRTPVPLPCQAGTFLSPCLGYTSVCRQLQSLPMAVRTSCIQSATCVLCLQQHSFPQSSFKTSIRAAPVVQRLSAACSLGCDPGDLGSSPGRAPCMEPVSPSACVSASLSVSHE